jgi:hypothetical protein
MENGTRSRNSHYWLTHVRGHRLFMSEEVLSVGNGVL